MPSQPKYAVIYALRVIQLLAICAGFHFFLTVIAHVATGKLRTQILGLVLTVLVLIASSLTLAYLQGKYPDLSSRALKSADRRFDTPLNARTQTFLTVLLLSFLLLVIGYMMVCLYRNPPWLP